MLEETPLQWFPWPDSTHMGGTVLEGEHALLQDSSWQNCCCSLFSHILDQLSLCKYLFAKCCCSCWCCLCLAVTGWCHSAVRCQRSYFRGAFSKDSRRTGECRSAHCTQHRWIFKYQMPPQDPVFLHETLMSYTFAFPIMFLLSHQFHEGSCGTAVYQASSVFIRHLQPQTFHGFVNFLGTVYPFPPPWGLYSHSSPITRFENDTWELPRSVASQDHAVQQPVCSPLLQKTEEKGHGWTPDPTFATPKSSTTESMQDTQTNTQLKH